MTLQDIISNLIGGKQQPSFHEMNHMQRHVVNEALTRAVYSNVVRAGDHVLDLGANAGEHSSRLSSLAGEHGVVHAFEPNRDHFAHLLAIPNLRLWPFAAGDTLSVERLHIPRGLDGWASLVDITAELTTREFEIRTVIQVRVDDIAEIERAKITFAKIDVERRELQALSGMEQLIREARPVMVLENANEQVRAWLDKLGYRVLPLADDAENPLPNSAAIPTERDHKNILPSRRQVNDAIGEMREAGV